MFRKIKPIIAKAKKFVITTHVNPDGDGLGSEIGLAGYLKSQNKTVHIINTSPVPKQYEFLGKSDFKTYNAKTHDKIIKTADVIFVLDISVSHRLDRMRDAVMASPAIRICVDHHLDNDGLAQYNCIDDKAPATAELIFRMVKFMQGKLDRKMATALYTGLITDTGNFRFNSTLPSTHAIAGELIAQGIRPDDIYCNVYEQATPNSLRLLGRMLEHLNAECQGEFSWTYLSKKDFKDTKTNSSETEGFVDYTLRLATSRMGAFFYETPEGFTKVSLRSKGTVNVQAYAKTLGGGGHKNASGITIREPFSKTVKKVVGQLKRYYSQKYLKK